MRILTALTYYRPHTSGLTIYTEQLTRALAKRGHQVTVLTSRYDPNLPAREELDGVHVVRANVIARISKGVLSRELGWLASEFVPRHDILHLHLPQFDAPGLALRGRLAGKPVVLTYHCDLLLPPGRFNPLINWTVHRMNHLAARLCDTLVTYTQDYADHSPYVSSHVSKLKVIPPPVALPQASEQTLADFAQRLSATPGGPVIGMAARLASEKGVEILLEALPAILERYPHACVLFAGQYQDVLGEAAYARRLAPLLERYQNSGHWQFLGVLDPEQMAAFYRHINLLAVPSLNSTEAFGLVQIEAMINGIPCVASDLPGVRQPVLQTGMGKVVPIGDEQALAAAILEVLADHQRFTADPQAIRQRYSPEAIAGHYEELFTQLLKEKGTKGTTSST
jgi:glycosyltransferase involved in cell wall biosynthesis